MKRERKYRAYDKRFGVMIPEVVPYGDSIIVLDVVFNEAYGDKADERAEIGVDDGGPEHYCITDTEIDVMDYAGFKDRKGDYIYEGDYVKEDFKQDGSYRSIGLVEFYEGSFGSRTGRDRFRIPALFSGKAIEAMNLNYYEIMGNKYQNPELQPTKEPKF